MAKKRYVLEGMFGDNPPLLEHVPHCHELSMVALHAGPGEVVKLGKRIAHVRVVGWQDDPARPFASGHGNLLL